MSDDAFLKEIQESFIFEAEELLNQSENLFISLAKTDIDHQATFAQIKRLAHNFKGSGKAVGFDELSHFSHTMENLLISLNSGVVKLDDNIVSLLLECNDALKADISNLRKDRNSRVDHNDLIEKLVAANNPNSAPEAIQTAPPVAKNPFAAPIARPPTAKKEIAEKPNEEFFRISTNKVDELIDSFGEQVILLSALDHYKEDLVKNQNNILKTIANLKKLAYELQQTTLSLRMVNLKVLFSKLERAIFDTARVTGKKVELVMEGTENELDKVIAEHLSDPLIHMVRNSIDHGIESAEERIKQGKDANGKIFLSAKREGGKFVITIQDDGRGINKDKVLAKAIEKGLVSPNHNLKDEQIFNLIFENDFSTKEQVSEISGRGVGMNVVKETLSYLKGTCEIKSQLGLGTTFIIRLPLSLSLFNGLVIGSPSQRFIVPSSQVVEIVTSNQVEYRSMDQSQSVIRLREQVYNLIDLSKELQSNLGIYQNQSSAKNTKMILISENDGVTQAYQIDHLFGIQRIVQKPLSPEMNACKGASGITILGDGNPAFILDLKKFFPSHQKQSSAA